MNPTGPTRHARATIRAGLRAALLTAALAGAGAASAQPASDPNDQAATLFREGREELEKGNAKAACEKFTKSLGLVKRASTVLNLAQCEEKQGHFIAALGWWKEGIVMLEVADERLPVAKARVEDLDRRIPKITVRFAADVAPGSKVSLDGRELAEATLGQAIAVDAGEHALVVTAPDRLEQRSSVSVAENERRDVTLTSGQAKGAGATPSASGSAAPTATAPGDGRRTWGFVVGGVGLAGLAAWGATAGVLAANDGTIKANCPERRCNDEGFSALQTSNALLIVNAVALGVGVAGVGAGLILILTSPKSGEAKAKVSVAPAAFQNGGGVSFSGVY